MYRDCVVKEIGKSWQGAQTLLVQVTVAPEGATQFLEGAQLWALSYPDLVGTVEVSQTLRIEVSAPAKGLGTSAGAMVVTNLSHLPEDNCPSVGHVVKARYMPIQPIVLSVDEPDSPYHEILLRETTIPDTPVVVADLHSALTPIVLGIKAAHPDAKIAYIWTDTAALPVWLSRQVAALKQLALIDSVISCGQAMGGDLDAASFPSALVTGAHVVKADVIIAVQGPGNLGTATPYGFSGIEAASWINMASAMGARVIGALRMSHCDERARHRGISHHSMTLYQSFVNPENVCLAVPTFTGNHPLEKLLREGEGAFTALVESAVSKLRERFKVERVPSNKVLETLENSPVTLRTMGRGLEEDPAQFIAPAVAGYLAGRLTGDKPQSD